MMREYGITLRAEILSLLDDSCSNRIPLMFKAKVNSMAERAVEVGAELAVYKRALEEAVSYPASDRPEYGGDYEEAKKGWTERFLAIAREELTQGGADDEA